MERIPQWIIEKKRDGCKLSQEEIEWFVNGYSEGEIPDYQMAAFAMAVYFQGMDIDEIFYLTKSMLYSGKRVDLSSILKPKVGKHSTGGVGDKVSLILAPLVASCGVVVPMLAGRGLGITGGTIDKLESIPGFRTNLSLKEIEDLCNRIGCCITAQTEEIVPADRKFYALRDVTATVPSIPLIASSIMSKKLAEGTDALVLDIKVGNGAFMKDLSKAKQLANIMGEIGMKFGIKVSCFLTGMEQPLGEACGNWLEVVEAVKILQNSFKGDISDIVVELAKEMLFLAGNDDTDMVEKNLSAGKAYDVFCKMVAGQGGSLRDLEDLDRIDKGIKIYEVYSESDGWIKELSAEKIGRACLILGGGRKRIGEDIDYHVGVRCMVKVGDKVSKGDIIALVYGRDLEKIKEAILYINDAIKINDTPVEPLKLIMYKLKFGV